MTNCLISWCLVQENGPRSREATPLGECDREGAGTCPTAPTCPASVALAQRQFPISNLGLKGQTQSQAGPAGTSPSTFPSGAEMAQEQPESFQKEKEPFHKVAQR